MIIKSIIINSYKSFNISQNIEFQEGFNLIVGKNNVGKSSLLEALKMNFENNPHKSIKTKPNVNSSIQKDKSSIDIVIIIKKKELFNFMNNTNSKNYLPILEDTTNIDESIARYNEIIRNLDELKIKSIIQSNKEITSCIFENFPIIKTTSYINIEMNNKYELVP